MRNGLYPKTKGTWLDGVPLSSRFVPFRMEVFQPIHGTPAAASAISASHEAGPIVTWIAAIIPQLPIDGLDDQADDGTGFTNAIPVTLARMKRHAS